MDKATADLIVGTMILFFGLVVIGFTVWLGKKEKGGTMKLPYEDTTLLLEILDDALQKYNEEIQAITDDNGCVKLDVPSKYSTKLLRKQSAAEFIINKIKHGMVEF